MAETGSGGVVEGGDASAGGGGMELRDALRALRVQAARRKDVDAALSQALAGDAAGGGRMKQVLGAWDLCLLGIGGVIGAGVFVLTGAFGCLRSASRAPALSPPLPCRRLRR